MRRTATASVVVVASAFGEQQCPISTADVGRVADMLHGAVCCLSGFGTNYPENEHSSAHLLVHCNVRRDITSVSRPILRLDEAVVYLIAPPTVSARPRAGKERWQGARPYRASNDPSVDVPR